MKKFRSCHTKRKRLEILKEKAKNVNKNLSIKQYIQNIREINNSIEIKNLSKAKLKRDKSKVLLEFLKNDHIFKTLIIRELNKLNCPKNIQVKVLRRSHIYIDFSKGINSLERAIHSEKTKLDNKNKSDNVKEVIRNYLNNFYLYSEARNKKRKIIFHMGPTNSGKSYNAIEAFKNSSTGCYLAPLRMLAWEVYEKCNDLNISLITGEEKQLSLNETHSSSTIEMANFSKEYDVAIIDEIQMLADKNRGWAWTKALLQINASEIHLCGDSSCLNLIKDITNHLGDELIVKEYQRKTKLTVLNKLISLKNLKKGDALITFSRKNIFYYKQTLEQYYNKKVSVVYGMLSPEVRKSEAERFINGETDILISTDAIGMGLNLPIKRIIFSTLEKYYNKRTHPLTISEIKQIGGRAGRFGIEKEGFVGMLDLWNDPSSNYLYEEDIEGKNKYFLDRLRKVFNMNIPSQNKAYLTADLDNLILINKKLKESDQKSLNYLEFLHFFNKTLFDNKFFNKCNITNQIEQASIFLSKYKEANLEDTHIFSVAPLILHNYEHVDFFENAIDHYKTESSLLINKQEVFGLINLELELKKIDLYNWLKNQLSLNSTFLEDSDSLKQRRETLNNRLIFLLQEYKI